MIYFDAGATTLEKPAAVGRAMARAAHTMSSPGRGSYPASRLAGETAYLCRQEAAELLGVPQPENVVITGSATHGLNLAIRSLLGPGDRVVISGYEHNAVTRPLHAIPGLSVTVIDTPPFRPDLAAEEFCRAIRQKRPRAVICTHVSNVFGAVLPVEDIAAADYRTFSDIPCLYVETGERDGYVQRYWVSVESGLLVGAEKLQNGETVYRVAERPEESPDVTTADFTLPDGTVLHTVE